MIASHIKPWRDCASEERLDFENGLLLCPNHDALFDKGMISFAENGQIILSPSLSETDRMFMNALDSMKIDSTNKQKEYITYHRTHIFLKKPNK